MSEISTYLDSFVEHPEDLLLRLLTSREWLLLRRGCGREGIALIFLVSLPLHLQYWVSYSCVNGIPGLDQMISVYQSFKKEGGGVNLVFFETSHLRIGCHLTPF